MLDFKGRLHRFYTSRSVYRSLWLQREKLIDKTSRLGLKTSLKMTKNLLACSKKEVSSPDLCGPRLRQLLPA